MRRKILHPFLISTVITGGVISILLGCITLIFWLNQSIGLVKTNSHLVPAQYLGGLGFFLIGISILLIVCKRESFSILGGIYSLVLGLSTHLEYLTGNYLSIDHLFLGHKLLDLSFHPFHIAPNTAICFTLTGASLIAAGYLKWSKYCVPFVGISGSIVLSLSLVSLFGYLFTIPPVYTWGNLPRMSLHVALAFFLIGTGLGAYAYIKGAEKKRSLTGWTSIYLGIIIFVSTLLFCYSIPMILKHSSEELRDSPKVNTIILSISLLTATLFSLITVLTRRLWLSREELKISEERFRYLAQNANYAIITINQNGEIVFWNDKAIELYGYSPQEMMGKSLIQIMPERFREAHQIGVKQSALNGKSPMLGKTVEVKGLRKDGSEFWVDLSLSSWETSEGTFFTAIMRDITERKEVEENFKQHWERSKEMLKETMDLFALTMEERDPYLIRHHKGVTYLACSIAREMNLSDFQNEIIYMAGSVHDIGYIYTPEEILFKKGKLSPSEFETIKMHPLIGYEIIRTIKSLQPAAKVVLQHHERMNSTGYPYALPGKSILLESRVIAVADVVESMVSPRPYRPPQSIEEALEEISRNKETLYDPQVVDACLRLFKDKGFSFEEKSLFLLFNPLYFILLNQLIRGEKILS